MPGRTSLNIVSSKGYSDFYLRHAFSTAFTKLSYPHSPGFSGRRIASEDESRSPLDFPLIYD